VHNPRLPRYIADGLINLSFLFPTQYGAFTNPGTGNKTGDPVLTNQVIGKTLKAHEVQHTVSVKGRYMGNEKALQAFHGYTHIRLQSVDD
jgi:hypothetical protein